MSQNTTLGQCCYKTNDTAQINTHICKPIPIDAQEEREKINQVPEIFQTVLTIISGEKPWLVASQQKEAPTL